jgi:hypothetical protein
MRAKKPWGEVWNSEAARPVSEVISAILIGVPEAAELLDVLVVLEVLDDEPHAAVTNASAVSAAIDATILSDHSAWTPQAIWIHTRSHWIAGIATCHADSRQSPGARDLVS